MVICSQTCLETLALFPFRSECLEMNPRVEQDLEKMAEYRQQEELYIKRLDLAYLPI